MIIRKYYATLKILGSIWIYFETWEISMQYQGKGKAQITIVFSMLIMAPVFFTPNTYFTRQFLIYTSINLFRKVIFFF